MYISELITIINGQVINKFEEDIQIKEIRIDSRKVEEGDLFIALKGDNFNGHNFIMEAVNKKVCAIIIDEDINYENINIPVIKVDCTYKSLRNIASHIRDKYNIPLIAITGSVGKTTTKELIYNILSTKYNVLKNEKNNNNHIGLPLTLFKLNNSHQIIVAELGMNHQGEIEELSNVCKPNVAVITNIGTAHIGNLGSKRAIYKAKLEIIKGMESGKIIVNGDDKYLKKLKSDRKYEVYKCGINKKNDIYAYNIKCSFNKTAFNINFNDNHYEVTFPIPGCHLISNVLIAIKIGLLFNINIKNILEIIKNYKSCDKRMNIIKLRNNNFLIEDCYNSSYESLIGVLELIRKLPQSKVLILGDILELGKYSKKIHLKISRYLKKIHNCIIILVGNETKVIKYRDYFFNNNTDVINHLKISTINNSIILLKGSRKMQLEQIKDYLIKRY